MDLPFSVVRLITKLHSRFDLPYSSDLRLVNKVRDLGIQGSFLIFFSVEGR
jgi:hypothetical protein